MAIVVIRASWFYVFAPLLGLLLVGFVLNAFFLLTSLVTDPEEPFLEVWPMLVLAVPGLLFVPFRAVSLARSTLELAEGELRLRGRTVRLAVVTRALGQVVGVPGNKLATRWVLVLDEEDGKRTVVPLDRYRAADVAKLLRHVAGGVPSTTYTLLDDVIAACSPAKDA